MKRLLVTVAIVWAMLNPTAGMAADTCEVVVTTTYIGEVEVTQAVLVCEGSTSGGSETQPSGPRDSDLDALCVQAALSQGEDPFTYCLMEGEDIEALITPGVVASALRQLPLPAAQLQVQPANGRTLVNFATNFYTDAAPFDRAFQLLGQRVELHIVPSEFTWRFGDGETLTGSEAGAPYPDLRITHEYQRAGRVRPSVDTTYTARFRVNGGPWREVPGSVTIPGVPVGLEVTTATPMLVGSQARGAVRDAQ